MFGFTKHQKIEPNQVILDYNPDTKRVWLIRSCELTNNQVIDALNEAARCMGNKARKRRKK